MKVSVVIAATRETFLWEAINSFCIQDHKDKELIVVQDGGKQNLKRIVEQFTGNIRYYWKVHGGAASTYNYGFQLAAGDLVCKLDDDDLLIYSNSLSNRVKAFDDPEVEAVHTSYHEIMQDKTLHKVIKAQEVDKHRILERDYINTGTMMLRRKALEKKGIRFPEDMAFSEDWEFKIRCAWELKWKTLQDITYAIRWHGGNKSMTSRPTGEMDKCNAKIKERMCQKYL